MLRKIEEIRRLKIEGKRKWGKDLLEFLKPYLDAGRTYHEVSTMLSSEYKIDIDINELKNLKFRYSKIKHQNEQKGLKTSYHENKPLSKHQEVIVSEQEIAQKKDTKKAGKIDISKFDFRTPTPKPSYVNWLKNDKEKDDEKEDII